MAECQDFSGGATANNAQVDLSGTPTLMYTGISRLLILVYGRYEYWQAATTRRERLEAKTEMSYGYSVTNGQPLEYFDDVTSNTDCPVMRRSLTPDVLERSQPRQPILIGGFARQSMNEML
jgi:hypothetical protein